jgi:hypothetical protein
MNHKQKLYFRDQLREARAVALRDAEAFGEIIHVLERMGCLLLGRIAALGTYRPLIVEAASESELAKDIPNEWPDMHICFYKLYELVRISRNAAMHEGSFARHLTFHAIELSLILEDSLMTGFDKVNDYMVRNPVCASLWQPLSFIRQSMLINSFSYLPVHLETNNESTWQLISDLAIAGYLRTNLHGEVSPKRLGHKLEEAIANGVKLTSTRVCNPDVSITNVLNGWDGTPILVQSNYSKDLIGIITPFDLL